MSEFQIIKSSAGSGKTHTLVDTYLCLLFKEHSAKRGKKFSEILAVTFTNKAAEEMKSRIIEALDEIIAEGTKSSYLKNCPLKYTDEQLKKLAKEIQKNILHDYNFFAISTIDSFVQRVVRTFAFEFRLPASFNIQLNSELVKNALYDMIMEKMQEDERLLNWIADFIMERLRDNKSWNLDAIKNFATFIFTEKFWEILYDAGIEAFDIDAIDKLKKQIYITINDYRKKEKDFQDKIKEFLEPVRPITRSRGDIYSLLNTMAKFALGNIEVVEVVENNVFNRFIDNPKSINSGGKDEQKEFFFANLDKLVQLAVEIKDFYDKEYKLFATARAISENIYALGLFVYFVNLLDEYRRRYNEFLIIDLTVFLRKIIGHSDAPFIYEKIGQRFENIFIDEFQDTSRFQWENFKPLIANGLANGERSLVVGDVKQAIYRWRNGDWRILLYQAEEFFSGYARIKNLNVNYRSTVNIVEFNNLLFPAMVKQLADSLKDSVKDIKLAYSDMKQEVAGRNKDFYGRVQVDFFVISGRSSALKYELAVKKLIETIKDLVSQGYKYYDIAILVRKTTEITFLVNELIKAQEEDKSFGRFGIISNESLFVNYSPVVRTIVNALKYIDYKDTYNDDQGKIFYLLAMIFNYYSAVNKSVSISDLMSFKDENELLKLLPEDFVSILDETMKAGLYEKVQMIIRSLKLNQIKEQLPYLRTFEDKVLDFMYQQGADVKLFLQMWEEEGADLTVDMSGEQDAIKIMTIHKSKGLAFPVVIVPFADWQLTPKVNDTIVWAPAKSFPHLPVYPIKYKQANIYTEFEPYLNEEQVYSIMDNLNLLYVAFTRPKEQLIVFSHLKKKSNGKLSTDKHETAVNKLLYKALENSGMICDESQTITTDEGEYVQIISFSMNDKFEHRKVLTDKQEKKTLKVVLSDYPVNNWKGKINIVFRNKDLFKEIKEPLHQSIEYGDLMHNIMSEVKTLEQLPGVVEKYVQNGLITEKDKNQVIDTLYNMVKTAGVEDWFSNSWNIATEQSIILPQTGKELRPDRVIYNDKEVIIIDFKFAEPNAKHKIQVRRYVDLYKNIPGNKNKSVRGFLLYGDGKLIEV